LIIFTLLYLKSHLVKALGSLASFLGLVKEQVSKTPHTLWKFFLEFKDIFLAL